MNRFSQEGDVRSFVLHTFRVYRVENAGHSGSKKFEILEMLQFSNQEMQQKTQWKIPLKNV